MSNHQFPINSVNCIIVNKVIEQLSSISINAKDIGVPPNRKLADPTFHNEEKIYMLIGSGIFWERLCISQIKFKSGLVLQQNSL